MAAAHRVVWASCCYCHCGEPRVRVDIASPRRPPHGYVWKSSSSSSPTNACLASSRAAMLALIPGCLRAVWRLVVGDSGNTNNTTNQQDCSASSTNVHAETRNYCASSNSDMAWRAASSVAYPHCSSWGLEASTISCDARPRRCSPWQGCHCRSRSFISANSTTG